MASTKKSSWFRWLLFVVVAAAAVGAWWWFFKREKELVFDYRTVPVARGDLVQAVTANGAINAVTNVQVGSQISGILQEIRVDFNASVKEGDLIAQIDPSTYQRNVASSEADLLSSKAALELAQVNARRALALQKDHLIPDADADTAVAALHQADAMVKMREAAVERDKVDLQRTTIYAPISGIVISRNVDVGQTVAASFNTPTLFLIANDLHKMQIEALVSEADVGGVEVGQRVDFAVDAFFGRKFTGVVQQVRYAPITNQNVVNYTTIVSVNNADLKLRPGMTAGAQIITAERPNVLRVPNAALRFRPPEKAPVITNAVAAAGPTGTNGAAAKPTDSEPPTPPWVAEGRRPNGREEMDKYAASLTPAQREVFERRRQERMQARGGGGGEGGGPGGGRGFGGGLGAGGGAPRAGSSDAPASHTVYVIEKDTVGDKTRSRLKPVTVKTGISDGAYTEVISGLSESDAVVTGLNTPLPASAQGPAPSPFGGPMGGGFRPR
jgi:HlyD family secretion protein